MYYIGTIFFFGKSINVLYFWKIRVATLNMNNLPDEFQITYESPYE